MLLSDEKQPARKMETGSGQSSAHRKAVLTGVIVSATMWVAVGFGEEAVCFGEWDTMRTLTVAVWLGLAAMIGVQNGSASQNDHGQITNNQGLHGPPAPMIGVPAILIAGGVLLVAKILRRRRLL